MKNEKMTAHFSFTIFDIKQKNEKNVVFAYFRFYGFYGNGKRNCQKVHESRVGPPND